jgi:ABC-type Fe3+/spermidine/putrescine transport system ATPase subunit
MPDAVAAIEVRGLTVGYGSEPVLDRIDLTVRQGEFIAVLGSSGCGKTTLLRTIAGFQRPLTGNVFIFGDDVTDTAPEKRGVAMVFQSYALWPHMTVLGNMGYGLKLRGRGRQEIRRRVTGLLALLNLRGLEDRKVTELSGGQRQRVALGRALAIEPSVLLLDEPLSNLDANVRMQLRGEIKSLQQKLGFAALHVTHDREEAMTMADRIVVMGPGRIAQAGTPEEIFDRPASPFIASFMGAENTIEVDIAPSSSGVEIKAQGASRSIIWNGAAPSGRVTAYFRDDIARFVDGEDGAENEIVLQGSIVSRTYPGGYYRFAVKVADRLYLVKDERYRGVGQAVGLGLPIKDLHLFPAEEPRTPGRNAP